MGMGRSVMQTSAMNLCSGEPGFLGVGQDEIGMSSALEVRGIGVAMYCRMCLDVCREFKHVFPIEADESDVIRMVPILEFVRNRIEHPKYGLSCAPLLDVRPPVVDRVPRTSVAIKCARAIRRKYQQPRPFVSSGGRIPGLRDTRLIRVWMIVSRTLPSSVPREQIQRTIPPPPEESIVTM